MKIRITKEEIIKVTPKLLAAIFCEMDNDTQAEFFNEIARISIEEWPRESPEEGVFEPWDTQASGISGSLNDDGKYIIILLARYCKEE